MITPSDVGNPIWRKLVLGETQVTLNFLAAKILLSRLQLNAQSDASSVASGAKELFDLYLKNEKLPSVQKDTAMLLGK